jgi:hypothetical protein
MRSGAVGLGVGAPRSRRSRRGAPTPDRQGGAPAARAVCGRDRGNLRAGEAAALQQRLDGSLDGGPLHGDQGSRPAHQPAQASLYTRGEGGVGTQERLASVRLGAVQETVAEAEAGLDSADDPRRVTQVPVRSRMGAVTEVEVGRAPRQQTDDLSLQAVAVRHRVGLPEDGHARRSTARPRRDLDQGQAEAMGDHRVGCLVQGDATQLGGRAGIRRCDRGEQVGHRERPIRRPSRRPVSGDV